MSDTLRDRIARALSEHWHDMSTGESLGRQKMLADAVLAVLRNPTDEDVERAAQTQYETNGYWQWHDATEPEREDARRDFIRGLTAYLGGDEA